MRVRKMIHRLLLLGTLASGAALAQATPSALERIADSGELRVCLTGDYKPFGFLRDRRPVRGDRRRPREVAGDVAEGRSRAS